MISKSLIEEENFKKQGISIEPQGIFTGTLDSWITGTAVGTDSSISAVSGVGIKSVAGKSASGNNLLLTSSFYIIPSNYKSLRLITIIKTENCNFSTRNAELDLGLFTSDVTSFIQFQIHYQSIRTRVANITYLSHPALKMTDPSKQKVIEFFWDTQKNYIDVFDNYIFIYRFTGNELPDKNLSYRYRQYIKTLDTASDKIVWNQKLKIELEI